MRFRLLPNSVTLDDAGRRNNHSQVAAVHPFGLSWAIIIITLCDLGLTVRQPSNAVYR